MNNIITETKEIAYNYLKEFGFSDAQIVPLIAQANKDLERELNKLEEFFSAQTVELSKINDSLHALKGLLFNLGNHNLAEKLENIKLNIETKEALTNIKQLLFDNKFQTFPLSNNLRVLYVEDSESVRINTLLVLEEFFEHKIDTAVNGEEGFQKYKTFYEEGYCYDIVITDINMPIVNGVDMIKNIHKLNKKQNIIVISAHSDSYYLLELINIGISNFILKPIETNLFKQVLSRVIEIVQNQKTIKKYHDDTKAINIEINLIKIKAEEASLQKSQFLANMSHEICTPLNAITGFISILEKEEHDVNKLKYLKIIQNYLDSLLQIINDILDISKIESRKLEIDPVNFNPYDDLISIAKLFQANAAQKGVILKIKYNIPKFLYSDPLRIKQILSNLLSNAIKFTPKGSSVKCIIWYINGKLNIRIKDYGIGIPYEKQEHIFESFSQAEDSTVREYGGTGLGLSISSKLTKMLDGELTLKSQEGKGSVFLLSVPMQIGKEIKQMSVNLNKTCLPSDINILLVEDNEANQMYIGIILNNAKIIYEIANNGIEAIEKFKTKKYDLILMDENMPKLSGIGATKIILQIEKKQGLQHTPIVSLSANTFNGDKERFLQVGMDDYLSKPVKPDELIQSIYKLLLQETTHNK